MSRRRPPKPTREAIAEELAELLWDYQQIVGYHSMNFCDFRELIQNARRFVLADS